MAVTKTVAPEYINHAIAAGMSFALAIRELRTKR